MVGDIDGLSFLSRAAYVGIRDPKSPAGAAGLKTGDSIAKINGTAITKWRELEDEVTKAAASGTLKLDIERGTLDEKTAQNPEKKEVAIALPPNASSLKPTELLASVGIEMPQLYLWNVEKESPAAKAGLQSGDRVLTING